MPRANGTGNSGTDAGVGVEREHGDPENPSGDSGQGGAATGRGDVKATIYTDRLEWLIAKAKDKRSAWMAHVTYDHEIADMGGGYVTLYGLANTEHQFRLALLAHLAPSTRKLTAREIQEAMAEELAALGGSK